MTLEITQNRQIILDTETTGMNEFGAHYEGHCIIEIGAVEMINRRYTGRKLHLYIKPDRLVDPEAIKVHGITDEMLADKPDFQLLHRNLLILSKGLNSLFTMHLSISVLWIMSLKNTISISIQRIFA